MAVIGWHNKPDSWVVAGWAFRQVLEDVRSQCATDSEMVGNNRNHKLSGGPDLIYHSRAVSAKQSPYSEKIATVRL